MLNISNLMITSLDILFYAKEQSSSWQANQFSTSKKFPAFYGTRMFIAAFTRARQLSLSSASSVKFMPPNSTS
jgi:hypothetical protein